MLQSLHIRHLLLIEKLDLDLDVGLNIFSGESGAGKSLVLYGIALLLGARFDHSLLAGEKQASVMGVWRFPLDHPLFAVLTAMGVPIDGEETLIVRRQLGQGANVFINDTPIGLRSLASLAEHFAEMYGQFAAHRLQEAEYQRHVLDDFAGLLGVVQESRRLYGEWQVATEAFHQVSAQHEKLQQEAGYLEHILQELDGLNLQEDEFVILTDQRRQAREAMARFASLTDIRGLIQGGKGNGPLRQIHEMQSALLSVQDDEEIEELIESLERAAIELTEVERAVDVMLDDAASQQVNLEEIEERLFRISELARKHHSTPEQLPMVRDNLSAQLQELDALAQEKQRLGDQLDRLRREMDTVQAVLSAGRREASEKFASSVNAELPHLHLARAALEVEVTALDAPTAGGRERIQFLVQTQPDVPMRPLLKVVSGGELSRVLLAMALCLSDTESPSVRLPLLFDEIDAGMGGETAAVLGARMQKLANVRQVIAVTHSPQMAASARCHIVVQKSEVAGHLKSTAKPVQGAVRREEIARMLAGEIITEAARHAADALLSEKASEA